MMEITEIYVAIAVLALAIILVLLFCGRKSRKAKKLSPLTIFAFVLIIAGICFGDNRIVGYGFIGAGVVVAVIDLILREIARKKRK
jgi:hypothetical protein